MYAFWSTCIRKDVTSSPLITIQKGVGEKKSDFFWIKSSAKRAFGGCLGSKRR